MSTSYTAHYISGTHWDREWYQPFQDYRMRLVQVMDGVLDVLEQDERFAYFHADGQMRMILDYLEIRPENRQRIVALAQAGRLLLGPWDVLPDEMLVSGEALFRNLMAGHRYAQWFGVEAMKFGYLCDEFGHVSQIPQILANFGIDATLIGRGTNEHSHPAHFLWESPDGTRALTYKLQDAGGYGALTFVIVRPPASTDAQDRRPPRHASDADGQVTDYLDDPALDSRLRDFVTYEQGRSDIGLMMLIDALDHRPVFAQAPELLERMRRLFPDGVFVHSSLPQYAAAMRAAKDKLPVYRGELRHTARARGGYLYVISNCLSSRYPIKQANDANQTLLERWAEPYLLWANLAGARHLPATYLERAWDFTLQNHAHDSICGCSLDQVHKDMEYRFDQARLIGDGVVRRALQVLAPAAEQALPLPEQFQVVIAQAEPQPRRQVVALDIVFPPQWTSRFHDGFIGEDKNSFRLFDAAGNEVPYQLLAVQRNRTKTIDSPDSMVSIVKRDVHTIAAEVDLPALGYTSLEVRPATGAVRLWGTLRTGPLSAENEHLAVSVNSNGTLHLLDKATGRSFDQLLTFVDDGEVGDGWFHISPISDEMVSSAASACDVGVAADGPLMVTFRLRTRLQAPARYDWAAAQRSHERREMVMTSDVTLYKGARYLSIKSVVDNCVEDHRLRLLLPSGLNTDTWWADLPFDLVERSIALDASCVNDNELAVPEKNMLAVAALVEGQAGLGFVAGGGLHEVAVHDDAARTLAVTLLRGFRRPIATDGQPGGQILGQHTFTYALAPLSGVADLPSLLSLRDQLATGVRTVQTDDGFGLALRSASLLSVSPAVVRLSACKPAGDGRGAIVRLYNPLTTDVKARLATSVTIKGANLVNGNEDDGPSLPHGAHGLEVAVPAKKIVSMRIVL